MFHKQKKPGDPPTITYPANSVLYAIRYRLTSIHGERVARIRAVTPQDARKRIVRHVGDEVEILSVEELAPALAK